MFDSNNEGVGKIGKVMGDKRLQNALAVATVAGTALRFAKDQYAKYEEKTRYTARIGESSFVYRPLMLWINEQTTPRSAKFVSNYSGVYRFYDGSSNTKVTIEGHRLSVSVEKPNLESMATASYSDYGFESALVFTARNADAIDALHRMLEGMTEDKKNEDREISIWNPNQYNNWNPKEFHFRDIDSVFLPRGAKESLIADLDNFMAAKERYGIMGIPWHRGYMLWGEPGNGKSSLVAALAHRYRFNLYNLPLSSVKDDKALGELISNVNQHSILLLEDIDIFSNTMRREQADKGPTLAGLLNALDGVNTPHGLLTFITTNHKETLDPALIRPGRVDYSLELRKPVTYQVESMFERSFDEPLGVTPREFSSMAELSNIFKTHPDSPENVRLAIKGS